VKPSILLLWYFETWANNSVTIKFFVAIFQ